MARYDASGWGFPADIDWPLRLFVTKEWHDLVSRAVGVDTVPYVSAGIHHHDVGGENGRPHSDLNPVYFAEVEPHDGMVSLRGDLVDLKSGRRLQENTPVTRQRPGSLDPVLHGQPPVAPRRRWPDGTLRAPVRPHRTARGGVAPVNNTLLAFECTPNSFHSFISNRVSERNSITMWLYRSDSAAATRWGERNLERWQESPPPTEVVADLRPLVAPVL